jgi:chromate reductase, NAD(P)H dehydrogenase (quinone)
MTKKSTNTPQILAFAGSTRTGSFNKKLIQVAAQGVRDAGAVVTVLDLRDLPMPLYDGDLEEQEGMPANAQAFKTLLIEHHGLLIASPEYNSSISGVLKNAIDWASRPAEGEPPLVAFTGKVASLMSASPGGLGGLRGLIPLRSILGNIGVIVLPDQIAISKAHEAFDDEGRLQDEKKAASVMGLGKNTAQMLFKLLS